MQWPLVRPFPFPTSPLSLNPTPPPMSSSSFLTIAGVEQTQLAPTTEAIARRDELLAVARRGKAIANAESAQRAAAILKDLATFARMVEASRKGVKDPVLDLGKRIDSLAATLTDPIKAETKRIGDIVAAWQEQQRRAEAEAKRKAHEEEQRIIRGQREREQRAADEAEAAELARREAEQSGDAKAAEKAERDAAESEARIEADREAAEQAILASRVQLANTPARLVGMGLRSEVKFEVTDIYALFEALPGMVTLSPNTAAIKAYLKTLPEGQTLPGVRHWREAKTTVR